MEGENVNIQKSPTVETTNISVDMTLMQGTPAVMKQPAPRPLGAFTDHAL